MARALVLLLLIPTSAFAQSFSAGAHFASARWSEFDGGDSGFGGRVTWMPSSMVGVDAEVTWYPSEFPPDRIAFSSNRVEALFGATIGPRISRVRPFVKAAAGFLKVGRPIEGLVCPAISPPRVSCTLAFGRTLPAYEIGGGIEAGVGSRAFVRADVTDRILKYPGPALTRDLDFRDGDFFGHALRVTIGGGVKF